MEGNGETGYDGGRLEKRWFTCSGKMTLSLFW